jgi:hypothetical protein
VLRVRGELLQGALHHLEGLGMRTEGPLRANEREAVQMHELAVPDLLVEVSRVGAGIRPDYQDPAHDLYVLDAVAIPTKVSLSSVYNPAAELSSVTTEMETIDNLFIRPRSLQGRGW